MRETVRLRLSEANDEPDRVTCHKCGCDHFKINIDGYRDGSKIVNNVECERCHDIFCLELEDDLNVTVSAGLSRDRPAPAAGPGVREAVALARSDLAQARMLAGHGTGAERWILKADDKLRAALASAPDGGAPGEVERLRAAERDALAMVLFVGLCGGERLKRNDDWHRYVVQHAETDAVRHARDRLAAAERALAEARGVVAPFASYAGQHRHLDNAEGEIGEFYGPAFRVSISYAALRAARDWAREDAAQLDPSGAAGAGSGGGDGVGPVDRKSRTTARRAAAPDADGGGE